MSEMVRCLNMKHRAIISRGQALQILRNDLRRLAREKHAGQLRTATAEQKAKILARIEEEVEVEVRQQARKLEPRNLLH